MTSNTVYRKQLIVLAFILSLTCKVCMLPRYMAESAGRQSWIAVAVMMALEMVSFWFIYGIISRGSILDIKLHPTVRYPIFIFLFCVAVLKILLVFSEAINYISITLFENGTWMYILIAMMLVVMYMSYKGVNTIVRTSQIVIIFVAFSFIFTFLLYQETGSGGSIFPVLPDGIGPIFNAQQKHLMWFIDFTPLMFLTLSKDDPTKKWTVPVGLILLYIFAVGFQIVFISVYGDAAPLISNAFSKIASFNYLSDVLGGVDFPIILSWILMIIIKISTMFYVAIESATVIIKRRPIAALLVYLLVFLLMIFAITDLKTAYRLSTSWVRFLPLVAEFILPIILFVIIKVRNAKNIKE